MPTKLPTLSESAHDDADEFDVPESAAPTPSQIRDLHSVIDNEPTPQTPQAKQPAHADKPVWNDQAPDSASRRFLDEEAKTETRRAEREKISTEERARQLKWHNDQQMPELTEEQKVQARTRIKPIAQWQNHLRVLSKFHPALEPLIA